MTLRNFTAKTSVLKGIDQLLLRGVQVLLIFTVICLIVPFAPNMPTGGLDPSWQFGMNQALAQGMAVGRDVIFTFGPFASIYTKTYHPATDHLMLFGSFYLALSYGLVYFLLVKKSDWFLVGVFSLFLVGAPVLYDPLFFSYPLIVSVLCIKANGCGYKDERQRGPTLLEIVILFFPFGLLPLIKGSFLLICVSAVVLVAISLSLRKKWSSVIAVVAVPIVSAFVFWNLSGQESAGIYAYLKSLAPIISGYTEAMAVDGPNTEVFSYLIAASVLLIVVISETDMEIQHRFLIFLAFAAYLFIAFKGGFVRHDGHAQIASIALVISSFVVAFALRSPYVLISFALSFGVWIYIDQNYSRSSTNQLVSRINSNYKSAWLGAKNRLAGKDKLELQFDEAIKNLNGQAKFPIFQGTTDIYSYNQSSLIASGNAWNPRPIFQSYSVYTPTLSNINKEHLLSKNAPDNVIFRIEPIDRRLPSIEDGASWPTLLTSYPPSAQSNGFLYLRRKAIISRPNEEILLRTNTHSFGEAVQLPIESTPIFVEVLVKPSFIGRLINILYKPSQLQIELELKTGKKVTYRLIAGMASAGFIVSPLIETTDEFGLLYGGLPYLEDKVVKSFSISPVNWKRLWGRTYEVTLKKFNLNEQIDISNIYDFNKFIFNIPKHQISLVEKCDGNIDSINGVSPSFGSSVGSLIRVKGWLAKSTEDGTVGDSVLLVLRDTLGKYRLIGSTRAMRPDVGAHFKKSKLDASGFELMADVGAISGDFMLGLAYTEGDQVQICPQFNIPVRFNGNLFHEKN